MVREDIDGGIDLNSSFSEIINNKEDYDNIKISKLEIMLKALYNIGKSTSTSLKEFGYLSKEFGKTTLNVGVHVLDSMYKQHFIIVG